MKKYQVMDDVYGKDGIYSIFIEVSNYDETQDNYTEFIMESIPKSMERMVFDGEVMVSFKEELLENGNLLVEMRVARDGL